ncbi:unnamed protein product, partial [Brassica oleracea var. botrytis]
SEVEERQREPSSSLSLGGLLHAGEMDQIMNKVGSYWLGQKANKEFNSVGDDFNSLSSSIEGGTKWLVNKLKVEADFEDELIPCEARTD